MKELSSVDKGDASEAVVLSKLKMLGYAVLSPWGDNQRYDLAIDIGDGEIERVQVKTARIREDGAVIFKTSGNHTNTKGTEVKKYDKSQIDSFMVFIQETEDIIYVPISEAPETGMVLRYEAEQNQPHINWVDDFILEETFKY